MGEKFCIDYFPIPDNTLCLPPKFCITYCLKMFLEKCNTPRSIKNNGLCKIWGQTECIMGNWKIENRAIGWADRENLPALLKGRRVGKLACPL